MNPCALSCQQAGMREGGGVKERMKSDGEEEVYSANLGDLFSKVDKWWTLVSRHDNQGGRVEKEKMKRKMRRGKGGGQVLDISEPTTLHCSG